MSFSVTSVVPQVRDEILLLRLFQRSVLHHQLLPAVIRETDGQLCILALAFSPKDSPDTKFGVPDL